MEVFPKTVYTDLVDLPDPLLLGLTIHYYNHSDSTLYMKIFIAGTNWSSNSVELGSLASGTNAYKNLDNFSSRTKPASETTEALTLTLKGYTDSGYSDEAYAFSRTVTVIMIKSDDGSWTEDESDNFNDGTVQGWDGENQYGYGGRLDSLSVAVATDFVLSPSYSLKMTAKDWYPSLDNVEKRVAFYKAFTTPNRNTVYAIVNVRGFKWTYDTTGGAWSKHIKITIDGNTVLVHIGTPYDVTHVNAAPREKWLRIVVPLTKNTTLTVKIVFCINQQAYITGETHNSYLYNWLDDFKIISKD